MKQDRSKKGGFTLIEVLIVIGIIAILATVVIIAINPAKQFAQARNAQRESNVSTILNAIGQNLVDNKGVFVCSTTSTPQAVATPIGTASGNVDLTCLVPTYIPSAIPSDPTNGSESNTQYTINLDSVGRFTICSPGHAESSIPGSNAFCLTR